MVSPRLTPEVAHALAEARERAQKRGHRVVMAEHVLLALGPALLVETTRRGVNQAALVRSLEARLASIPAGTSYRDTNAVATSSPGVDLALRVAQGFLGLGGPVTVPKLVEALLDVEPSLRRLVDEARYNRRALERLFAAADAEARARGHANILGEHALIACIGEERVAGALRCLGLDPDEIAARLGSLLVPGFVSSRLQPLEGVFIAACIHANALGRTEIAVEFLVVSVLRDVRVRASLQSIDVAPFDLLFALVHGRRPATEIAEPRVQMVLHDDDYTTMEFVVAILRSAFDRGADEAMALMRGVHEKGEAAVGVFDAEDARRRLEAVRVRCEEEMMPLRISMLPAPA